MSIIQEIAAERERQKSVEGWSPAHDDEHEDYALSDAASCYAADKGLRRSPSGLWPWSVKWWKPTTHRRNLIKAAALIVAEVERLDRASLPASPSAEPCAFPATPHMGHECEHDKPAPAKEPFFCCKDTDNPCHPIGDYCLRGRPDAAKEEPSSAYERLAGECPPAQKGPCVPPCNHLHAKGFDLDDMDAGCACGHRYGEHQNGPGPCAEETGRCSCLKFTVKPAHPGEGGL